MPTEPSSTDIITELEHRRDLATRLGRYADGREGLGIGQVLSGVGSLLGAGVTAIFAWAFFRAMSALPCLTAAQAAPGANPWGALFGPQFLRIYLAVFLAYMLIPIAWISVRERVIAHFYRDYGTARSGWPKWEDKFTVGASAFFLFGCICYAAPALHSLGLDGEARQFVRFGVRSVAVVTAVGFLSLAVLAMRYVRGWRNWLGWGAICAPIFLAAPVPFAFSMRLETMGPTAVNVFTLIVFGAVFAGLYLPAMSLYMGLRDHFLYIRLRRELDGLTPVEVQE